MYNSNVYTIMKSFLFIAALFLTATDCSRGIEKPGNSPFDGNGQWTPKNQLDTFVLANLRRHRITAAKLCSDEIFVRRIFLDVIGTLPTSDEVRKFFQSTNLNKRTELIDALLKRDEFNDYWTLKWCDLLRVKAEFPINLWPNAVQAYHRWIYDAVRTNMPYDRFARELLTSSGSNFRTGQVNFYRAIQGREPNAIAEAVALTFMGTRLDNWPQPQRADMAAFFFRVSYKKTPKW
jgi:hypothetical protein